jgi:hypothetical protein
MTPPTIPLAFDGAIPVGVVVTLGKSADTGARQAAEAGFDSPDML